MRCPRCQLGTLELQRDGTIYLCKHCKYIQDNESAQFVTTEQFTETLRNVRMTTRTVKTRRPIKRSTRKKMQVDAERLKELRLFYNKCSRRLREFSLHDKSLLTIWKRVCASILELYQHLRTIMTEHPDPFSSIHANFVTNATRECQANNTELSISPSNLLVLLSHANAMAIATYVFATELAGRTVLPSCVIAYLRSRDVSQKPPSLLLVSRCYRILPIVALPSVTRARLLFDVETAFTQIASLCLVFQGYKLANPLLAPWVNLSTHLSTLCPQPLCGFHAFMSTSRTSLGKGIPQTILSPCRYICIFLLLAYIPLTLSCSGDELWKHPNPKVPSLNLTTCYHNFCTWTTETAKFFKGIGLDLLAYRPFNSFPLEEFVGMTDANQNNREESSNEQPSLDDVSCMLAAICELSVERFVRSSLEVARIIMLPQSESEFDQSKLG